MTESETNGCLRKLPDFSRFKPKYAAFSPFSEKLSPIFPKFDIIRKIDRKFLRADLFFANACLNITSKN